MFGFFKKDKSALQVDFDRLSERYQNLVSENAILEEEKVELASEIDSLEKEVLDLKAKISELESTVKALSKNTSVRLTDSQAKKHLKNLTKSRLEQMEQMLKDNPQDGKGGAMVYDKKTRKTSYVEFNNKAEALAMIERAKAGEVKFVS